MTDCNRLAGRMAGSFIAGMCCLALLVCVACGELTPTPVSLSAEPGAANSAATSPRTFEHVFIIIMENGNYAEAMAQPYFQQLAAQGALLTNYSGVAHPSYPNYLALLAGSTFGINTDNQTVLDETSLVDKLEKAGLSWKFYAEQYPANQCFTGDHLGNYYRKHLPVLSFRKVQSNPELCKKVVPAGQLGSDVAAGNLPAYSFYVPDQLNDGHDTGVAYGAKWLSGFLPDLLKNSRFMDKTLLVVTFDESESLIDNKIYTVLLGPDIKSGSTTDTGYNHYNLLRTIENNFQLGTLGREDDRASAIIGVWKNR